MYELGKEVAKTLITIFVMGFFLQIGWNTFIWDFLKFGDQMTYGTGVGFWILFYSIAFSLAVMKRIFGWEPVNVHHHFRQNTEAKEEE